MRFLYLRFACLVSAIRLSLFVYLCRMRVLICLTVLFGRANFFMQGQGWVPLTHVDQHTRRHIVWLGLCVVGEQGQLGCLLGVVRSDVSVNLVDRGRIIRRPLCWVELITRMCV